MPEKSTKLPSPSAPAEEVRAYIIQVLVTKYSTPVDIAERHASKWEIGTFSQLTKASQQNLSDIFNSNVGLCLYNALQDDLYEWIDQQPSAILAKYAFQISAVILASVLLLAFSWSQGLPIAKEWASWAFSPFPWFFFSGSTAYYIYKHGLRGAGVGFGAILAYVALVVGFCASLV
ncbi:hypothetical protein ASPSYDRAFT_71565 [Aspergillus sydowii CBS 593.65]|uniref:Uncharacterized protein n=1 Tax=Aspergillus sydowii CBS 593.65 TaxID=1036612 RepID=A0A1L9T6F4_9EURO|nr:uncharacterized protein ASPSYDRAFT_71565 [Aspergillus sydowii CBS 593.65]OJJ55022.1 hypothetical protein ASPSYDRAFT_71565 [Aspergillus sydowii CBS 593.65]